MSPTTLWWNVWIMLLGPPLDGATAADVVGGKPGPLPKRGLEWGKKGCGGWFGGRNIIGLWPRAARCIPIKWGCGCIKWGPTGWWKSPPFEEGWGNGGLKNGPGFSIGWCGKGPWGPELNPPFILAAAAAAKNGWCLKNKKSKIFFKARPKMGSYGGATEIGGVEDTGGPEFDMDLKLKPGIDEYEFLGSPASTRCRTLRLARK